MKKIVLFLLLVICSLSASAVVYEYKTTTYTTCKKQGSSWSAWEPYQDSNLKATIDLETDVVKIYSSRLQVYRIYETVRSGVDDSGDQVSEFKFIDQDGNKGNLRMMIRKSGKSEIYIDYPNVIWVYSVVRTN